MTKCLSWVDVHGASHIITHQEATRTLKELFDVFPGGLTEIKMMGKLGGPVNAIDPAEENTLRVCFEDMLQQAPWRYANGHFVRQADGGYRFTDVQLAWHTLKCGYLAGLSYKGNKQ